MATDYVGIDYSLGRSNVDKETGIHYGVISQHTVGQAWYDSSEPIYGEPTCPDCGREVVACDAASAQVADSEWFEYGRDYVCETCAKCFDSDEAFPEEPQGFKYEDSDYTLSDCLDSDIFVLKSPYYTYAQFCSPCVPGAGNLDNPVDGGPKTYCLGHDWFEEDKAPYTVYRVSDDTVVEPE